MTDIFADRLSDYLDDEDLARGEREQIAAHLAECGPCRALLEDLQVVRTRAAALPASAPAADLWPGIAARLEAPADPGVTAFRSSPGPRRFSFTLPQLVAAGLALMVLSGGTVWLARHGGSRTDFEPISAAGNAGPRSQGPSSPAGFASGIYDQPIADLEQAMKAGRPRLDPATVRVLERNLDAIDAAIDECERALAGDPSNMYLNLHLVNAKKRKLMLLRRATALADSRS